MRRFVFSLARPRARFGLLLTLLLASCANLIDLEERKVSPGGSNEALCKTYCTEALAQCTAANMAELFMTPDTCVGTCLGYPTTDPGGDAMPTNNTLACRMSHMDSVASLGEPANSCPSAGPGGAAPDNGQSCGTNCEGYCSLYEYVCGAPIPDCLTKCPAIADLRFYNVTANYGSGLDTLQCRLAHLGAAAAAKYKPDPMNPGLTATHCSHSGLKSSVQCDVTNPNTISCMDFCRLTNIACSGGNQVYENDAQCEKTCSLLPSGATADTLLNNVRCRRENAYKALTTTTAADIPLACSNAGPAPAGCGAGKCESYCMLAKAACPPGYAAKYATDTACTDACNLLPDRVQSTLYSTAPAATGAGSPLQCRILHVERVLGGDMQPTTCVSALGGGDCP